MKKIFTLKPILSIIGLISCTAAIAAHPALSGGSGTEESPYQIATQEDLVALSNFVNEESDGELFYYSLSNDIDMSGIDFEPINNYKNEDLDYRVIFDGNNHIIKNLTIAKGNNYCGLFGRVTGNHLSIQNLTIENINIEVETDKNHVYVGGVVAYYSNPTQAGNSTISNCNVSGLIRMGNYVQACVGGIVGYGRNIDIQNCKNKASIYVDPGYVDNKQDNGIGGIVGKSNVSISSGATHQISQCSNIGDITGPMNVGGIAGSTSGISASRNNNAGHITYSDGYVGGIIGNANSTLIDFCCNIGAVTIYEGYENKPDTKSKYIGGIAGYTLAVRTYIGSYPLADNLNAGYIDGWNYTGGVCGYANGWAYNNINTAPITDGSLFNDNCRSGANIGSYPYVDTKGDKNPYYGGNIYDKQMSILPDSMNGKVFEGKEQIYGLYTYQLLYDSIYSHFTQNIGYFDEKDWIYNEGIYPVPNDIDPDFNVLASAVVKLDSSDRINRISHPFEVVLMETDGEKPLITSASGNKICNVEGYTIGLAGSGEDTLHICYKGMMREIPLVVISSTHTEKVTNEAGNAPTNVYTPLGRLVCKNTTPTQALDGLKQGIYVVGNKKMIKRGDD